MINYGNLLNYLLNLLSLHQIYFLELPFKNQLTTNYFNQIIIFQLQLFKNSFDYFI